MEERQVALQKNLFASVKMPNTTVNKYNNGLARDMTIKQRIEQVQQRILSPTNQYHVI